MNITDQQKLLVEEAKRRRQAAMADYERRAEDDMKRRRETNRADYERRQNQAPQSVDSQFASIFTDTAAQAADTACSDSSYGGGE